MQLAILRNVYEERNLSMKLYADRLINGLANQCAIKNVRPWAPPRSGQAKLKVVEKGMEYAIRYGVYPLSMLGHRSDIYHIIDHAYAHLLSCLPAHRTVVTCHDIMLIKLVRGEMGKDKVRPSVAYWLLNFSLRFLRCAAAVVTDSQATADDLVKYLRLSPERIRVVHLGVDPTFRTPPHVQARQSARQQFGFNDRPVLLHVGNNWFYKNLEGLIKALAILQNGSNHSKPVLVKAGKKLTSEQHELARSLGVADQIKEVGLLSGEDLQRIYWGADLLVFPSRWEGFGWPPLEAMASGTPVACSDRGSLSEVVGDAAAIVNPEEPEDIARKIREVLDDDVYRQNLILRGLERVKQFTWERTVERTYQVYQEVAAQNPAR